MFKIRKRTTLLLALSIPLVLVVATIRFRYSGNLDGIYLLKGTKGALFEVKDDIYLGEYEKVLAKMEFEPLLAPFLKKVGIESSTPYLKYKWNETSGNGYVKSFFRDGTKLLICFSRFLDNDGNAPKGLFVGGGLPYNHYQKSEVKANETGMAFYDGNEWRHLWCNANETITSVSQQHVPLNPATWQYHGSKVLYADESELILQSIHSVIINGVPFRIDRHALYRAGDRYFTLLINITNVGTKPAGYFYVYGDEPWVGKYGTSVGNVGWVRDKLHYFEGKIDPWKYSFAGMYDIGNPYVLGSSARYSGMANFIEWMGVTKPNYVYFSNQVGRVADEKEKVPLYAKSNRVIMLEWGPRFLQPNQSDLIMLAIGMADKDPKTGFPVKPEVRLNLDDLDFMLRHKGSTNN